jgi:hypothetical protein
LLVLPSYHRDVGRQWFAAIIATLVVCCAGVAPTAVGASSSWSVVASPDGTGAISQLNGVSCASPTLCFAVGYHYNSDLTRRRSLIERWNGHTWTVVLSPSRPPTAITDELDAASCASTTFCVATGASSDGNTQKTLTDRWNGTAWSEVASPSGGALAAVSCRSASFCFSAGVLSTTTGTKTLTERWNGTAWSVVANPTLTGAFSAVACSSATLCFATGNRTVGSGGSTAPLIERWNGSSWSVVNSPAPAGAERTYLLGVSCATLTFCVAVGESDYGVHDDVPDSVAWDVLRWNGTAWSIATAPKPTGTTVLSTLRGVSCVSASFCVAAGYYYRNDGVPTIIEQWNGQNWSVGFNPGFMGNLSSASCANSTFCSAVGFSGTHTLVEQRGG